MKLDPRWREPLVLWSMDTTLYHLRKGCRYSHPWDPNIVAVVESQSLFKGSFMLKAWKTGPQNSCQCRQAVASSSLSAFHNFVTSFADLPKILIIVKIDSIIWSFCLCHVCKIVYLIWARKLDQCFVKVTPSKDLASEILNKINISCYTEYKVF